MEQLWTILGKLSILLKTSCFYLKGEFAWSWLLTTLTIKFLLFSGTINCEQFILFILCMLLVSGIVVDQPLILRILCFWFSASLWLSNSKVGREFEGGKRTFPWNAIELWKSHEENNRIWIVILVNNSVLDVMHDDGK